MSRRQLAMAALPCALVGLLACGGGGAGGGVVGKASATEAPAGAAGASAPAAKATLPGDRLALRFVDLATQSHVEGDLGAAWKSITDHPQRSLLPYGLKSGPRAYRAVQMAFADADLEAYATLDDKAAAARVPQPVRRLDPVWNRRRAVYQSRQALYVPLRAAQSYRVTPPEGARLETALGLHGPAERSAARFRITVDGEPILDEVVRIPGKWIPREVDLPPGAVGHEVEVRFSVESVGSAAPAPGAAPVATVRRARMAPAAASLKGKGAGAPVAAAPAAPTGPGLHGFFADPVLWARRGGAPGPNVLFILLDTLRTDATVVMPRLNAFAARSARFEQAITGAAWTRPSMLAMYGADCPTAVGQSADKIVPEDADRKRFYRLAPSLLPRLLESRGYRVSAIGNNFFLLGYPAIGLDLGFAEVDDVRHPVLDTPAIARSAIRYLERNKDRSFFLHLHFDGSHWPYTPPDKYLTRRALSAWKGDPQLDRDPMWEQYLGEAAYTDDYVGRVLAALDRLGLTERTLVVIVGDHGEIFDRKHDHVVEALGFHTVHHHGWSAYDELVRVPLVVSMPKTIGPTVVPAQVRSFDITPTILDYLGINDATMPWRGRSLRPLIEGRSEAEERVAFVEGQNIRALRAGGFAYLRREDPRLIVRGEPKLVPEELYDLRADPRQYDNLVDKNPEALARMRALFAQVAPLPPDAPQIVYHLRSAPDERSHRVEAVLSTEGRISVRGVTGAGAEAIPVDDHKMRMRLSGPGGIDFNVEPPDAPLRLELVRDGVPVDLRRVLAGEFGLPLLDGDPAQPIDPERLRRLDAKRPPQLGTRGDLLLWRDPGAPEAIARAAGSDTDEVTGMMERWGYARPQGSRDETAAQRAAASEINRAPSDTPAAESAGGGGATGGAAPTPAPAPSPPPGPEGRPTTPAAATGAPR